MEKNTDRILWSILVLAIGVSLFIFGKPAFTNIIHGSTQQLSYLTKDVDASSNSDFSYSEPNTTDHTISIVGYSGHKENLTTPQYRKIGSVYYKVTAIGDYAFSRNANLKHVTISDGLTSIGNYAFYGTKLTSVDLPSDLTSIGDDAFGYTKLTNVHLPAGLTSISAGAFAATKLTSVDLPSDLTSIGDYAFQDTKLTSVHLPAGLTSIGDRAFYNIPLTSVDLPAGLTSIGAEAFRGTSLTSVDFPSGLKSIGDDAFWGTKLTSVHFPAGLKSIGDYAFDNTSISTISFKERVDLGKCSFTRTNLKNVTLPTGSTYHKDAADSTFDPSVNITID